mmetsp:Transcript_30213/g.95326  ORF Transcript_30213/g.95326 Transcript_30213/m.95326 type:complete len:717 (+) Transcript_30213:44-2194(+)
MQGQLQPPRRGPRQPLFGEWSKSGKLSPEHLRIDLLLPLLLLLQQLLDPVLGPLEVRVLWRHRQPLFDVLHCAIQLTELLPAQAPAEHRLDVLRVELNDIITRSPRLLVEGLGGILATGLHRSVSRLDIALRTVEVAGDLDLLRLVGLIWRHVADNLGPGHMVNGLLVSANGIVKLLRLEHVVPLVLVLCGKSQPVLLLHVPVILVRIHAQLLAPLPFLLGRLLQSLLLVLALLRLLLEEFDALSLHVLLGLLQLRGVDVEGRGLLGHVGIFEPQDNLVEVRPHDVRLQQGAVLAVEPVPDLVDVGLQGVPLLEALDLLRVHGLDAVLLGLDALQGLSSKAPGTSLRLRHRRHNAPSGCPGSSACGYAGGAVEAEAEGRLAGRLPDECLNCRNSASAAHQLDPLDACGGSCESLGQGFTQPLQGGSGGGLEGVAREGHGDVDLGALGALGQEGLQAHLGIGQHAQLLEAVDRLVSQAHPRLALHLHLALVLLLDAGLGLAEQGLHEALHAHCIVAPPEEELCGGLRLGGGALLGARLREAHNGHGPVGHADVHEGHGPFGGALRQQGASGALREGGRQGVGVAEQRGLAQAGDRQGVPDGGDLSLAEIVVNGHAELLRVGAAGRIGGEHPQQRAERAAGRRGEVLAVEGDGPELPVLHREEPAVPLGPRLRDLWGAERQRQVREGLLGCAHEPPLGGHPDVPKLAIIGDGRRGRAA